MNLSESHEAEVQKALRNLNGNPDNDRKVIQDMSPEARAAFVTSMNAATAVARANYDPDPTQAVVDVGRELIVGLKDALNRVAIILHILDEEKMRDRYETAMGKEDYDGVKRRIGGMGYALTQIGSELGYILYGARNTAQPPASAEATND